MTTEQSSAILFYTGKHHRGRRCNRADGRLNQHLLNPITLPRPESVSGDLNQM